MSAALDRGIPRQNCRPQVSAGDQDSVEPARRGSELAESLTDLTRTIAAVEASGRIESELAGILRDIVAYDRGAAAARRLSLAEDAARGAQVAAERSERLQQHARTWAEQDDMVALREALEHAATLLAGLARAEKRIADILTDLASRNSSDRAERQLKLAAGASAAACHARDLAQTVHRLAGNGGGTVQPGGPPDGDTRAGPMLVDSSASQRLADIEHRLAELRHDGRVVPGDGQVPRAGMDASQRAQEARRHWQDSVGHLLQARQLTTEAFGRAASAHDRAAEASARSARAGIGDVAEHNRMAAFHRAAANSDRQQADSINDGVHDQVASVAETAETAGTARG